MRARIVRTGGFAGLRREWRLDEGDLPAAEEERLRRLLDRAGFFAGSPAHDEGETARARDAFLYEIAVEDAGRARTVRCAEPALTPPLRECLEALLAAARPHPSEPPPTPPPPPSRRA